MPVTAPVRLAEQNSYEVSLDSDTKGIQTPHEKLRKEDWVNNKIIMLINQLSPATKDGSYSSSIVLIELLFCLPNECSISPSLIFLFCRILTLTANLLLQSLYSRRINPLFRIKSQLSENKLRPFSYRNPLSFNCLVQRVKWHFVSLMTRWELLLHFSKLLSEVAGINCKLTFAYLYEAVLVFFGLLTLALLLILAAWDLCLLRIYLLVAWCPLTHFLKELG